MAVLIASNLRKELAGDPLFDGVSFKLERRDRLALSGPNGAGKTTLLRALVGETELQGGELVFEKGVRAALHDQRPPLERDLTLREYVLSGAADLVAHERWFVEAVTTAVLELENGRATYFPGAWHVWRREKAARAADAARTAERQSEQIARLERFVERFRYKASKARQAQSRLKEIERIKARRVEAPDERRRTLGFEFLKPARSGRTVVEARGLELAVGGKELLRDASFAIERGEHVGLVGPDGSGKTTLLETLLGRRDRGAGTVRLGHGVEPAHFSQHDVALDERRPELEAAQR